ncbi:uncharacterized protein SPSK_03630 [Sporothrix schenckii 1099-18]|uniref:Uncharacterized protein n=2 Tax=Sporothrix schenckii TaxID=29908 RepID=U7PX42_SPOS1|nr:uncharacterized protein SPSK_03630 [Sporothrix schenckii 1099-18]ERS99486.1 hypothetical protein HMPREF1624_04686 [Sporothrix schenckii ATCC 58251]KJR82782.1 hypothetical protein SPSK_03630 [Sporothrix schenckii 1099-18]
MPRLFGRSQTPTPAQAQTQDPPDPPAPRAKLVRRTGDHFSPLPGRPGQAGYAGSAAFEPLHREASLASASLASASASASASAYEVLLNGPDRSSLCGSNSGGGGGGGGGGTSGLQSQQHRYYAVRSQRNLHRSWLAVADARRPSASGERPPPRKLVKDPGGSARPSASREIPDEESDLRRTAVGESPHNNSGNAPAHDRGSFGGPSTLGIRRKISRWRDLRW